MLVTGADDVTMCWRKTQCAAVGDCSGRSRWDFVAVAGAPDCYRCCCSTYREVVQCCMTKRERRNDDKLEIVDKHSWFGDWDVWKSSCRNFIFKEFKQNRTGFEIGLERVLWYQDWRGESSLISRLNFRAWRKSFLKYELESFAVSLLFLFYK